MDSSTFSISNTISKGTINEDVSGRSAEAISNEQIVKGDEILDTYEVVSDAVLGGMGSVWRVHHKSWNVDLAMKRPQPSFFAEGGTQRKEVFVAECENWINLGIHPNIVSCYYVREIGGVPSIFSQWMDGGSLKEAIRNESLYEGAESKARERILDIAIQTARGLRFAHEQELVHQDVKPGNILLTNGAGGLEAKVADFGLARAGTQLELNDEEQFVKSLMIRNCPEKVPEYFDFDDGLSCIGYTPEYAPKEQTEGHNPEKWMDVYAWALTVIEMFAGRRTWENGVSAVEEAGKLFGDCRVSMPARLQQLLVQCLRVHESDLTGLILELKDIYRNTVGQEYLRPVPRIDRISPATVNNWAISYVDIGGYDNAEAARALWKLGLEEDPHHAEILFNKALFAWRNGELDVTGIETSLSEIRDSKLRNAYTEELKREAKGKLTLWDGSDLVPVADGEAVELRTPERREKVWGFYKRALYFDGRRFLNGDFDLLRAASKVEEDNAQLLYAAFIDEDDYLLLIYRKLGGTTGWENEPRKWFCYCLVWNCIKGQELMREKLPPDICFCREEDSSYVWSFYMPVQPETLHFQRGEKAAYKLCSVDSTFRERGGTKLYEHILNAAQRKDRQGKKAAALKSLERWSLLPGFKELPERIHTHSYIGADLPKKGIKGVYKTGEKAIRPGGDVSIRCDSSYTKYCFPEAWDRAETAMKDTVTRNRVIIQDAEFSGDRKKVLWPLTYGSPDSFIFWSRVPQLGAAIVDVETGATEWMETTLLDNESGVFSAGVDNHVHINHDGSKLLVGGHQLRVLEPGSTAERCLNENGPYLNAGFLDEGNFVYCVDNELNLLIIGTTDGREYYSMKLDEEVERVRRIDTDNFEIKRKDRTAVYCIEWEYEL